MTQKEDFRLSLTPVREIPDGAWQKRAVFPDWQGYTDDTLAMNSTLSFQGYHGQGTLYLSLQGTPVSFTMYVNGLRVDTSLLPEHTVYALDCAPVMRNRTNTVQIANITPLGATVELLVPFPTVLDGDMVTEGLHPETLELISDIIQSDIRYGFPSAQLAVVRNGRRLIRRCWGRVNRYDPDGKPIDSAPPVTNDTLYDLASVTKMMATNLALQKLVTDGKLKPETRIVDVLGPAFVEDTIDLCYARGDSQDPDEIRSWKSELTVRDLLCHQGGFPPDPSYYNIRFDAARQTFDLNATNALYAGCAADESSPADTFKAICKTPLYYRPGTRTVYSDVDYMILGMVVEHVTGEPFDRWLKEQFYAPLGLDHVTFSPLKHGFGPDDCAATELHGNTRDGSRMWPGCRTHTLQGEVHDGKAFHNMNGISGHAGLFGNATDLTTLAFTMLTGGYGNLRFFSRNVIDYFSSPKHPDAGNWGMGWWREGDSQRAFYFGPQSGSGTVGHQGWTGTLIMIDSSRDLVIAYLTNKINSPVTDASKSADRFDGNWFTSASLGFVAQLLSVGMDESSDPGPQLMDLLADMAVESRKLIPTDRPITMAHPAVRNVLSKLDVLNSRAKASGNETYIRLAERIRGELYSTYGV